jgi:hypothetical protein
MPHFAPKLQAVGVGYFRPGFAERLEDAIERSERAMRQLDHPRFLDLIEGWGKISLRFAAQYPRANSV